MKIEIYNKPNGQKEKILRLNTKINGDGDFLLFACDENGDELTHGLILRLSSKTGKLIRKEYCNAPSIVTDKIGCIALEHEYTR